MPRTPQPESPAGFEARKAKILENLPELTELKADRETVAQFVAEMTEPPRAQIKTARSFTGRIASGRGRTITADDSSFAIESDKPMTAGEIALAQRNGFDDFSEKGDGRIMVADKGEMRRANGDINHTAYVLTGRNAGRER